MKFAHQLRFITETNLLLKEHNLGPLEFYNLFVNFIAETDKNVFKKEIDKINNLKSPVSISVIFVSFVREKWPFSTTANYLWFVLLSKHLIERVILKLNN